MKLNNNSKLFLLFAVSLFTTSCSISPLLPLLNQRNEPPKTESQRPTSDKYDSIWNINSADKNTTTPDSCHTPSLDELLNPDYAWIGSGSIIQNKNIIFVFDKDKYTGTPIVYFTTIDSIYNEPYYKLYEQRNVIPTTMYYDENNDLIMSLKPVFFVPEYDNFMDNNFNLMEEEHNIGYATNIFPATFPIRRNINSSIGEKIISYMFTNDLKTKVIGETWYPVQNSVSKTIINEATNYMFLNDRKISISKGTTEPSGNPTANKGWDIWQYKGYDDISATNYIYVYDYVTLYIENNRYTNNSGNVFDVMYTFDSKYTGATSIPNLSMLKYSVKP